MTEPKRCWVTSDPFYNAYHDEEWGRPVTDEHGLFERLCLEGFQSGLSWLTILRKRENFRRAFSGFEIEKIARYTDADVQRLITDAGIVRNRAKIEATIANPNPAPAELRATFWPKGMVRTMTIAPGATIAYYDFVHQLFGVKRCRAG